MVRRVLLVENLLGCRCHFGRRTFIHEPCSTIIFKRPTRHAGLRNWVLLAVSGDRNHMSDWLRKMKCTMLSALLRQLALKQTFLVFVVVLFVIANDILGEIVCREMLELFSCVALLIRCSG